VKFDFKKQKYLCHFTGVDFPSFSPHPTEELSSLSSISQIHYGKLKSFETNAKVTRSSIPLNNVSLKTNID